MVLKTEREPPIVLLSIGRPFITINGSLEAPSEAPPRMRIVEPDPGSPPVLIVRPETRPLKRFSGVTMLPRLKSSEVTEVKEPVASFMVVVP